MERGTERQARVMAVGVVVVAVAAGLWFGAGDAAPPEPPPPAPAASDRVEGGVDGGRQGLLVHVSGWVERPGLVALAEGARVADAVHEAGGALPGARLGSLNLAAPVTDGERVEVPGPGGRDGGAPPGPADTRVRVNQADAAELERLPGVGPVLAERIVEHRERQGPFETTEDLLDVPGIGEVKLASLREHVAVP